MIRYPITIELLSETIFGNGESRNGVVNTDILLDKDGFPFLLGKTFKGYLKEAVNTILRPYYEASEGKEVFDERVNLLFGQSNRSKINKDYDKNQCQEEDRYKQQQGKVRFSNFYLHSDISKLFNEHNKELILNALTDIRFGIRVEEGVAKNRSLRTARVLKKGLVFVGYIECDEGIDSYKILKQAVAALKNIGVHKSRGKGLVKIDIAKEELVEEASKISENVIKNFDYILYELKLIEPVKIGDSQSKYDYENSKLYITGSTVRGGIINRYLKVKGNETENIEFKNILKKINFYDAYPLYIDGERKFYSFPTPNIFRISKDCDKEDRKSYDKANYSVIFDLIKKSEEDKERRVIKLKKGSFCFYEENKNELYQFDVKKDFRFHHSEEMDKSNIFRYEAISKGQSFYGVIDVSKIDSELKQNLLEFINKNSTLYLGGSRTGGYGKSQISKLEAIKDFSKLKEKLSYLESDFNKKGNLDVYFLSDSILRDEKHQITSSFSSYIEKGLGIAKDKEEYKKSEEITPVMITGFNSKWESNLPYVCGIEKGSAIRFDVSNNINAEVIENFMKHQYGDRKQEGFGRVIINPKFFKIEKINYVEYKLQQEEYGNISKLKIADNTIKTIKGSIEAARIDYSIRKYVLSELKEELELTNSKVNNVIQLIDKSLLAEECLSEFKKEIAGLEKLTQNGERNGANANLIEIKIGEYSLSKLINLNELSRKQFVEKIIKRDINSITLYEVDKLLLRIIREILYYSLKAKDGEN